MRNKGEGEGERGGDEGGGGGGGGSCDVISQTLIKQSEIWSKWRVRDVPVMVRLTLHSNIPNSVATKL